ncbi:ribonuclease PH [candidate division WOR-3 bacterium]|nr:ribonuclease PH [candidate division WOR-3 bacterium]MCK4575412.1 ribonuclease PH [candidate division WOR-3 bacterium]
MIRRNRTNEELRPQVVTLEYIKGEKSSVLYEIGLTKVLCVATLQQGVPKFLESKSTGWITAEYGMLPRCSPNRIFRERVTLSGRSQEIQRFIGRSLRAGCDLSLLEGYTIIIDVDVIQADGGTRIAAINGGMIALYILFSEMVSNGQIEKMPVISLIGAVSVGSKDSEILLDPNYKEDSQLDVDMNIVMNEDLKLVEINAITEGTPLPMEELNGMLSLAKKGIKEIIRFERMNLSLEMT